jgi:tripartite-type tricarboxylate transporter receptor subunit TctC
MSTKYALLAAFFLTTLFPTQPFAQSGNVTAVVVPFPAGGTLDVLARIITQKLGEQTKESFIVENKPGANGQIGAKAAAKAKADGRTWLIADGAAVTINPFLYPADPTFNAEKDLRPVRALAYQPLVLVVKPGFPAKTLKEFVDLAKRREVTYASGGIGSSSHLTMSHFSNVAGGLKFSHVPYKGGPQTVNALVSGEVDSGFIILPNVLPFIKRGQLVPVAVSSIKRSAHLPDVPTMIELGYPGFEVENRYFAWLPSGASDETAKKVDALVLDALSDPVVAERLRAAGLDPTMMDEAESRKWLAANRDIWQKVIRDNNIKPE